MSDWKDPWGDPGPLGPKDIKQAFDELPQTSQAPRLALENRLQGAAWWYSNLRKAHVENPEKPASVAERLWRGIERRVQRASLDFQSLRDDPHLFADWCGAAEELATFRYEVYPPHVDPTSVSIPPLPDGYSRGQIEIWPTDDALNEALKSLSWLESVCKRAAERAVVDKQEAGGPKPDEAAYVFVRTLAGIYGEATGLQADKPRYFSFDDDWRGHFLDFAEVAFAPVDNRGRAAIAALIQRVLFDS